jgi:hypothetical protein
MMNQWAAAGVFDYVLPFLLVFAIVFGILNTIGFGNKHKGVQVIIAVVLGALALQFNYLGDFLKVMAPNLGIGVSVILGILILVGLFVSKEERRYWFWGLGAIGFIISVIIVVNTFDTLGYSNMYYYDYAGYIIGAVLLLGLIIAVGASGSSDDEHRTPRGTPVVGPWSDS